ncbi:hypothetical protein D0Z67_29260 (plasmid) [Streptomyces seoulensis]|uniref:Uncharacterized protein n=1 Tax=Streptomyces seoulensis TaxID=73044 RepID=A0A4P6U3E1_STRSO|nr:hypothetical protein [Streptomyces seoulensis]QBJ94460.1 hypothetical protein D0Z67_29260 [Streptomyces seoulensis]
MTATPPTTQAIEGRRVTLNYTNNPKTHPGVITRTETTTNGVLLTLVRLDGHRSSIAIPADHDGLRYLNEVGPIPDLPMGRFQPSTRHPAMDWEYDGVIVLEFEDGDIAAITGDRIKAVAAVATYLRERHDLDETAIGKELVELKLKEVVFEWEPEGAECAWLMQWADRDPEALPVHYLPSL